LSVRYSQKATPLIPEFVENRIRKPIKEAEEEQRLIGFAQQGDREAAEILVEANIPMVAKYANQMRNSCRLPFGVLLAEGTYGLHKSIYTWKPNKGVTRLMSWAIHTVKHQIIRAIRGDMNVRYPSNFYDSRRKIDRAIAVVEKETGFTPNVNQVMEEQDIPILDRIRYANFGFSEVSMDTPVKIADTSSEEQFFLHDVLPDELTPLPDDRVFRREVCDAIRETLDESGDPRLTTIMFAVEGLDEAKVSTKEELALELHCHRERVRQLYHAGLGIIKDSKKLKELAMLN
jgi:RNA polymerase primary sigma factor